MADEALMELIRATRDDVINVRDNHLAHMTDDINDIKDSVMEMSHRVSAIENTINSIKNHWWKIVSLVIAGIFGLDMSAEMIA
jgi:archaellum component FlaC